jgi:hypothetical protein
VQDDERARIDVDGHSERLGHAVSGNVVMGRPDTAGGEDIDVARPKRLKRIDDRPLLVTDHPHFLEIDPERGQIFRDIADVPILGAAGQDLVADHQECGDLFGSGRVGGCHDCLGATEEDTAIAGYAASSHSPGVPGRCVSSMCPHRLRGLHRILPRMAYRGQGGL